MTRYMVTTDAGTLELSAHHPLDAYHARKWGELRRDGLDIRDGWTLGRPL